MKTRTYLANDRAPQTYDHTSADGLGLDHKVPGLVEKHTEARQVKHSMLVCTDGDYLRRMCVGKLCCRRQNIRQFLL